jgi:hypothetical protein
MAERDHVAGFEEMVRCSRIVYEMRPSRFPILASWLRVVQPPKNTARLD